MSIDIADKVSSAEVSAITRFSLKSDSSPNVTIPQAATSPVIAFVKVYDKVLLLSLGATLFFAKHLIGH